MTISIKVKYNFIFSIFFFLFLQFGFSQDITVLEEGSNEPIPGVAIYNLKKTKYVVTDINGQTNLDNFNAREIFIFKTCYTKNYN